MIPADYDFTIYRGGFVEFWQGADNRQPADLNGGVPKSYHEGTCPYYRPRRRD